MTRGEGRALRLSCIALAGADAAMLAAAIGAGFDPLATVAAHLVAVGAMGILARPDIADRLPWAFALIGAVIAGPIGPLVAMVMVAMGRSTERSRRDWYRELSGADEPDGAGSIEASIAQARAFRGRERTIVGFNAVMDRGSRDQQLALLGLLSQRYHPDYLPVLRTALGSAEPSVRVAAAAVFAKLRERYRARFADLEIRAGQDSVETSIDLAFLYAECAITGILDQTEARRAGEQALPRFLRVRPTLTTFDRVELAICRLLLETGDHATLCRRLDARAAELPPDFADLYLRALMRCGRGAEVHRLSAPRRPRRHPAAEVALEAGS